MSDIEQLSPDGAGSPSKIRILLADDHLLVREGIRLVIEARDDMEVVGEADDATQAWNLTRKLLPDVVVMDMTMRQVCGHQSALQVVERIKASCLQVKVLALSTYQDDAHIRQSLVAGVSGYLLKKATSRDFVEALHALSRGGVYLDPSVAGQVVVDYMGARRGATDTGDLSPRELEILIQVAWGHTNREIANNLYLSVKTIEGYKSQLRDKLGLNTRAEVLRYALRRGWMSEA